MKEKILLFVFGVFLLFGVISCSPSSTNSIPAERQCAVDADCVPAECCHAKSAVNKNFAADCSEMFCTMECAPETLDCGQGEVKCVEGECKVVILGEAIQ